MLTVIKLVHTVIWAALASSIIVLPITGVLRRFRWSAILTAVVLLECLVLLVNGGRCPLSDVAARFTNQSSDNFDIYLPLWLARYNKLIFGALFIVGELIVFGCWINERRQRSLIGLRTGGPAEANHD